MANTDLNDNRSAGAALASHIADESAKRGKGRSVKPLRRLWPFVAKYPGTVALFLIFLVLAASLTLSIALALKAIVDCGYNQSGTVPDYCASFAVGDAGSIGAYFLFAIIIGLLTAIFSALRFYYVTILGQRVTADLRKAVYDNVTRLSPIFFEKTHTGEVLSRLTTDTTVIEGVIGSSLSFSLRSVATSIGSLIIMAFISWKLTALVLLIGPLIIIPAALIGRRIIKLSRSSQDNLATASARAGESLGAIQTVQAFTREDKERADFSGAVERTFEAHRKRIAVRSVMTFVIFGLGFCGVTGVLWYGAWLVLQGQLSGGDMAAFIFLAVNTVSAAGFLTGTWTEFLRASGATERVMELLEVEPQITAPDHPIALGRVSGAMRFDDVSFSYPTRPEEQALRDVSFEINAGETVALVGPSGAGKTTVFQLLLRFYDVQSGGISLEGTPITQVSPQDLRSQFAIVQQNTPLFSGTAMDNIRYGRAGASDEDVIAAAKAAYAHDFIMALPDGYNTTLGESAATLSGGQRQRLAIARAILRDAPILLLDEATSALDSESEQAVQKAFDEISSTRTTLVIAHRLATVKTADRIIVMDQGTIVESGTHKDLVKSGGLYARLAKIQFSKQS